MAEGKDNYLCEKLLMALSPDEFSEEQQEIEEHIQDCEECRQELEMLKQWHDFFGANKDELASSVSACPSAEALVEFTLAKTGDPLIEEHITYCRECDEQVQLLRELSQEDLLSGAKATPSREERSLIEKTVSREYGESREEKSGFILTLLESLLGRIHIPSLAAGAVAAAILVLVLLPPGHEPAPLRVVTSDVVWKAQAPAISKGGQQMAGLSLARKTVAVVVLVEKKSTLTRAELQKVYDRLKLADRLGISYEVLSPREIKAALAGSLDKIRDSSDLADLIFKRTDTDYLLAFELNGTKPHTRLKGMLFQRPDNQERVALAQSGFNMDRLPERITRVGMELILEAEYSEELSPN